MTTAHMLDTTLIREWMMDAGQLALRYFGNVEPEWKGVADPVTVADTEIEQLLVDRINTAYPDHGILGEEFGGDALDREYLWALDPIDGTRAYVEGLPTWSITIALLRHYQPVFGVVYMPMFNDLTYTDGDDVIVNGTIVTGKLMRRWHADSYVFWRSDAHTLYDLHFTRIMAYGSTATHAAYTARGASVATLVHDAYLWDMAAMAAFMAKQGGVVADMHGDPIDFSRFDLHQKIMGTYIAAHPDVVKRLIPLLHPRERDIHHPAW